MNRLPIFCGRLLVAMAAITFLAVAGLRCLDAHRVDQIGIHVGRSDLTMLSAIDQIAFCFERDPADAPLNALPLWFHNSMNERDCPQRDDYSTYLIAMQFHPWFTPTAGWKRERGLKRFDIIAPWGPGESDVRLGRGVILPTAWPIALLSPIMLWLTLRFTNQLRRRIADQRIGRRFAIIPSRPSA